MFQKCLIAFITVISLWVVGCAMAPYAREVKKKPSDSGTIALNVSHSAEDRAQADLLMRTNCGSKEFKILEEGEAVVGQRTSTNASASQTERVKGKSWGGFTIGSSAPTTEVSSSSVTSDVKEWQIRYECVAKTGSHQDRVATKTKVAK